MTPRTARRRFVAVSVLYWLPVGLTIAPLILLFTERGMALTAVAGFFAAHSLTAAALELPTGGLSDVIGRRTVLAAAGLLGLAAFTLQGLGTSAWVLTLGMALMGAGRALSSGPAEAWYVDTVQAHSGPDADLRTGLARAGTATSAALAAGTLLGGGLPWLLGLGPDLGARLRAATSGLVLPLSVPSLLAAVLEVIYVLYVLTALPEPPRPRATLRGVLRGIPVTVGEGLRLGGRDALVRRILLSAGAAGAALAVLELLTPGRAADLTGAAESGAVVFAGLACAGFVCSALGSHLAPLAARVAGGGERAVLLSLGTGAVGLFLLGVTVVGAGAGTGALPLVGGVIGFGLVYLGLGAAGPNENDLLHRRVTGAGRATALSVQSLALQLVAAVGGLGASALPAGPTPWLLGGGALLAGGALWAGWVGRGTVGSRAGRGARVSRGTPAPGESGPSAAGRGSARRPG
ncbi:MFS transporter [Streptomyces liangshanensis]|uniref:MFS transporter n=1 Tax=Streptomyces liangshanensis TaxID=2717324 RepID=UPI0036DA6BD0